MESKSSKKSKLLIGAVVVMTIVAAYLGFKNAELDNDLAKLKADVQQDTKNKSERIILEIDSLILEEDYKNALELTRELEQSEDFENNSRLLMRKKMVLDIITIQQRLKQNQRKENNDTANSDDIENNTESVTDSLANALTIAKQEIRNLRRRQSTNPNNDYLEFSTSKGTKLHYVGNVSNNMANGYGIALLDTGSRYEGQWKDNKRHGQGKFYWDDGEDYEGEYKDDMRHGMGTYHWSNGEKYVGNWKNDMRNGHGEFYNKRGKLKMSGTWMDDELIEED